jgi:transposase IS200 family protein
MPWGLTRYQQTGQSHFVTFCCYHRHPLFATDANRRVFENALERVRRSFCLRVYGYVVMPEHIHLLVSEPERTGPLKPKSGLNVRPSHPSVRRPSGTRLVFVRLPGVENAGLRSMVPPGPYDFGKARGLNFTCFRSRCSAGGAEPGAALIATDGDEVEILSTVVAMQSGGHEVRLRRRA